MLGNQAAGPKQSVLRFVVNSPIHPGARNNPASVIINRVAVRSPTFWRLAMSIAKVTEISCSSSKSFEDAIEKGIERADKTLDKVKGAWVSEMKVDVEDGKVSAYRVNLKVTFILKG
jgi:flavin-binding protein dodecin